MAVCGCSNCLAVTTAVALLLFPVQYYVPDISFSEEVPSIVDNEVEIPLNINTFDFSLDHFKPIDSYFMIAFVVFGLTTYLWEKTQIKVMENKIIKLNEYLCDSVERLRALDSLQEQQEASIELVQSATCEYNLLLYLLRQGLNGNTDVEETKSKSF